jgi:hypothetical protein
MRVLSALKLPYQGVAKLSAEAAELAPFRSLQSSAEAAELVPFRSLQPSAEVAELVLFRSSLPSAEAVEPVRSRSSKMLAEAAELAPSRWPSTRKNHRGRLLLFLGPLLRLKRAWPRRLLMKYGT